MISTQLVQPETRTTHAATQGEEESAIQSAIAAADRERIPSIDNDGEAGASDEKPCPKPKADDAPSPPVSPTAL